MHAKQRLGSREVAAGNSPLNYDGATYYFTWSLRRWATRVKETGDVFRTVFGDSAMMSRIRPIISYQYANQNASCQVQLDFLNNYYNNGDGVQHVANPHPVNYYIWGGAGGWYGFVGSTLAANHEVVPINPSFDLQSVTDFQQNPTGAGWDFAEHPGLLPMEARCKIRMPSMEPKPRMFKAPAASARR